MNVSGFDAMSAPRSQNQDLGTQIVEVVADGNRDGASSAFEAVFADGLNLRRRDVEELKEFLVFRWGGALEFSVPAMHLFFGEAA